MSDANKAVVRRWLEEAMEKGNLDIVDELFAETYVFRTPGVTATGPGEMRALATSYKTAFPDMKVTIDDQISEGERVVTKWTSQGTHQGFLGDIPPTGNSVTMTGVLITRFVGGKPVEDWQNFDELGMLRQIGAVPPA
tara:strand:- start:91 stop:504 length:414 start_codon:yes stop_codon:yes gene_type:complete